jgi:hypothetical protein
MRGAVLMIVAMMTVDPVFRILRMRRGYLFFER